MKHTHLLLHFAFGSCIAYLLSIILFNAYFIVSIITTKLSLEANAAAKQFQKRDSAIVYHIGQTQKVRYPWER